MVAQEYESLDLILARVWHFSALLYNLVNCYIPSCDCVACIFVSGLVVERSLGEPKIPGSNLALSGFFSLFLSTSY